MNHQQRDLFKKVLLDLDARGRQDIADLPPLYGDKLWQSLSGHAAAETELEKQLTSDPMNLGARWIALPVDRSKTWRPILWLRIDFTNSTPSNLQVVLANLKEQDVALGFRFETPSLPSGEGEPGAHHYHHVQLLQDVRSFGVIHGVPTWFPKSFPTFPVDASTPVGLALCLFLAIYGFGFEEMFISQAALREQLSRHYRSLGCLGALPPKAAKRPRIGRRKK